MQAPDTCNIATTRAIRCAATSGLAYRHVAYLSAAFWGFLRCHPRRWSVTISPCWKIFSTVFANSLYYQRAISDSSTVIGGANNQPCCAPRGPVLTWVFDGTARTKNSPASWIPKRQSKHIRQSISMDLCRRARPGWKTGYIPPDRTETRPEGPRPRARKSGQSWRLTPFGRMETRSRRPGRFSREPEIDPVRHRSPIEANQKPPQP